jgi:hypothetical protein
MKKLFSLLLALALLLSCTGCANNESYDDGYDDDGDYEAARLKFELDEFWDIWWTSEDVAYCSFDKTWSTDSFELKASLGSDDEPNTVHFDLTTQRTFEECMEGGLIIRIYAEGDSDEIIIDESLYYLHSLVEFDEEYETVKHYNHSTATIEVPDNCDNIGVLIITDGSVYKGVFI